MQNSLAYELHKLSKVMFEGTTSIKLFFPGMHKPIMQIWIRVTVGSTEASVPSCGGLAGLADS